LFVVIVVVFVVVAGGGGDVLFCKSFEKIALTKIRTICSLPF
jgi:hypothetical protein